jgi:hypothetical protein
MLKMLEKILLKDPKQDPEPKPYEKSDSDPKKIITDPENCHLCPLLESLVHSFVRR